MNWNSLKVNQPLPAELPGPPRFGKGDRDQYPKLDKYEVLEPIGVGGMSTVYKARARANGDLVAIKLVSANRAGSAVMIKRFEQEFLTAHRLNHPNIVRSLDYGTYRGLPYQVMEFVPGQSLGQRIDYSGRLPPLEAAEIITQVADALDYLHRQKVIHRDVKPDNILFTADFRVKLIDLGLIKQQVEEGGKDLSLTKLGQGLGTPNFMAPEQFEDARNIDHRCDIYGLGATMYMAVTGVWPFAADNPVQSMQMKARNELKPPRQLVPTLSEQVERAILRAMSVHPKDRQNSCAEFVREVGEKVSGPRVAPRPAKAPAGPRGAGAKGNPTDLSTAAYLSQQPAGVATAAAFSAPPITALKTAAYLSQATPAPPPAPPKPAERSKWGQWVLAGALALGAGVAGFLLLHFR
jgi:serine/threonine protein kinase